MKRVPRGTALAAAIGLLFALISGTALAQGQPSTTTPQGWTQVGNTVSLSPSNSSSNVQLGWAALSPVPKPPNLVWVCNTGSVNAFVRLGVNNTLAATTNDTLVPNTQCIYLALNGNSYIAGITSSSSTTMSIMTGNGSPMGKNRGHHGSPFNPGFLVFDTHGFILTNNNGKTLCNAC